MQIAKYLMLSKQSASDTKRNAVFSCTNEENDGLQIVGHMPLFISDYGSSTLFVEGISIDLGDPSLHTKNITNTQLPYIPEPKICSDVITLPDICPDMTSSYSSSDISLSLAASQSEENSEKESEAVSSFTLVASGTNSLGTNSSDNSTSKKRTAGCSTPSTSKKSKIEENQAIQISPRRRKQLPLGPRHLEYDYNVAYRNFKETAYLELGKMGYRGPFKKGQLKTDTWSMSTEKLLLLKERPAYKKAARKLNKADDSLNRALLRGESWERTAVPAQFTWKNEDLQDYVSLRGNVPSLKDIGEGRSMPFVPNIPNTRSRKPSAKVVEMMEIDSSDQVTDNSPSRLQNTTASPSVNSVTSSGKSRTRSRRKKATVAVKSLVVETALQSDTIDNSQLSILPIVSSSSEIKAITPSPSKRKANALSKSPDDLVEKFVVSTSEDSPSSDRVNKRRKKEPKSDTSTGIESEATADAAAAPRFKRRTSERLKRQ